MIKVYHVSLNNDETFQVHKKNTHMGERYLTLKDAQFVEGTVTNEYKLSMTVPWHSVLYIVELWIEGEEPGSKPQPAKPKVKMWRMGKEEVIQEG